MIHNHSFNPVIASVYGYHEAVVLENISYWVYNNQLKNINFHDNRYWTYNSVKSFKLIFPYFSEKIIRNALNRLCELNILIKGNYNKSTYDRTIWYSVTDYGKDVVNVNYDIMLELINKNISDTEVRNSLIFSICTKGQMDLYKKENGFIPMGEPIPLKNTLENTNSKTNKHNYIGTEKTEIISSDDANQAELETEKDFSNDGTEFVFKDVAVYINSETGEILESDNCEVEHLYSKEEQLIPQTKQKKLQVKKKGSGANLEKVKKQNCKRVSVKDLDSNLDCVKIVNLYNSLSKDQPTQTIKSFSESLAAEINGMIELYGFDRYYNAIKLLLEDTSFKSSRYLYPYTPKNILVDKKDRIEKFIDLNASEIALQANLNNRYNQFCSEYEKVMGKTYSTKNEISEARLLYFELNDEEKEKALKMLVPVMYHKTMKMNEYLKLKIFMYDKAERTKILGVGSSPFEYCN